MRNRLFTKQKKQQRSVTHDKPCTENIIYVRGLYPNQGKLVF